MASQKDQLAGVDVAALVTDGRIHSLELSKVWVYLGHESEIPEPGDYLRRDIGLEPVVMVRGHDGKIRVFFNRCRHRARIVCYKERGNAAELTCPYHGWVYSTSGELIEPTLGEAYQGPLRQEDFALIPLPRQASYRGLVFASAAATSISFDEHLGPAKDLIDFMIDRSPEGEVMLRRCLSAASARHTVDAGD